VSVVVGELWEVESRRNGPQNRKMQRILQPQVIPSPWRKSYSVEEIRAAIGVGKTSRKRLQTRKKKSVQVQWDLTRYSDHRTFRRGNNKEIHNSLFPNLIG